MKNGIVISGDDAMIEIIYKGNIYYCIIDYHKFLSFRNAEVYLVTRTYTTRHGNGYEPKIPCPFDLSDKHETNVTNEFQGEFKTGALEVGLLNRAYERHCIDNYVRKYNMSLNLVVTHMDVIDGKFEIAEGDAYLKGCRIYKLREVL